MQERVKGPAIALIIIGVLNILQALFILLLALVLGNIEKFPGMADHVQPEDLEKMRPYVTFIYGGIGLFFLAIAAFVIFAGLRMLKMKSWTVALIASIVVMIPCFTLYTCPLGVAVGIWSIVVLVNEQVRAAFQQGNPPTT